MSERGHLASVIVRVGERGEFFATRESARRLIAECADSLPLRVSVIFDWGGVGAVTGAFMDEFAKWALATSRKAGSRGMGDDVREAYALACRRITGDAA